MSDCKELAKYCDHPSLSGAEGQVVELGRWPILWNCDCCGVTINQ